MLRRLFSSCVSKKSDTIVKSSITKINVTILQQNKPCSNKLLRLFFFLTRIYFNYRVYFRVGRIRCCENKYTIATNYRDQHLKHRYVIVTNVAKSRSYCCDPTFATSRQLSLCFATISLVSQHCRWWSFLRMDVGS